MLVGSGSRSRRSRGNEHVCHMLYHANTSLTPRSVAPGESICTLYDSTIRHPAAARYASARRSRTRSSRTIALRPALAYMTSCSPSAGAA
jgi:hypothetical protein